jgi:methyl-accepting chemotaxis protein
MECSIAAMKMPTGSPICVLQPAPDRKEPMKFLRTITHRWPIQRKLLTGFMLCLAVTTTVSLVATIASTSRALEERIRNAELPALVAAAKADIRRHVSEPLTAARDVAGDHFLLKWEADGQPEDGLQDFFAYATRLKARYGASSVYWVSGSNRIYLTDSGSQGTLKPEDDWFDQFMAGGKEYSLDLGQDTPSKTLTLFVNARFSAGSGHGGLAGIGLPMTALARQIAEYRVGDSGTVMLVRADGTVLVHKDAGLADGQHRLSDLPGFSAATVATLMRRSPSFTYAADRLGDGESVSVSTFIPELDAYVVAQVPTSELVGAVKRAAWTGPVLAAAISMLLALFMIAILARTVAGPVRRAASMLNEISGGHGDLSRRMNVESGDEVGQLAIAFNRFVESLHSMVRQVRDASAHVASAASQLAAGSLDLSQRTEHASSALQQTAATMANLTSQVQANVASTASVTELAHTAYAVASRGNESMGEVEQTMSGIDRSSQSVAEIIGVIDDIAFQTNILALNASVESARAGVHGRGFAVVAAEVRTLAQRAAASAQEVRALVANARRETRAGKEETRAAKETMQHVLRSVSELSGFVDDISDSTQKQSGGINEVNAAVADIDRATQQNSCLVEEVSATADSLREHAEVLAEAMGKFKLA